MVARVDHDRQQAAVVEVRVGEHEGVDRRRVVGERHPVAFDLAGEPWNSPQSTITRARSVDTRNWEPVTVVARPGSASYLALIAEGTRRIH